MHVWRWNSEFLNITVGCTYSNHWDWNSKERHVICGRRRTDPTRAASLLQGRRLDYRAGDTLSCRLYVKQSAVHSVLSLKYTDTQSTIQFRVKLKMSSQERHNSLTCGERDGTGRDGTGGLFLIRSARRGRFFFLHELNSTSLVYDEKFISIPTILFLYLVSDSLDFKI